MLRTVRRNGGPMDRARYWDEVAAQFLRRGRRSLWRTYCDSLCADLVRESLNGIQARRALKTDLFDEAVGEGVAPALLEHAAEVHGVDISQLVADAARARHPQLQTRVDDVRGLGYPDGYFDLVLSNSTLDHFASVRELDRALAEIHRVLGPGGRLVITLDNLANPVIALRRLLPFVLLNRLRLAPFFVGVTLTPSGLRERLTKLGFEVEHDWTMMHVPRVLAVLLCNAVERGSPGRNGASSRLVAGLRRAEVLSRLPSAERTGYYTAVLATKRAS